MQFVRRKEGNDSGNWRKFKDIQVKIGNKLVSLLEGTNSLLFFIIMYIFFFCEYSMPRP